MAKRIYDMNESELKELIPKLANTVERLKYERPNSARYRLEARILKDAEELLAEKQKPSKEQKPSSEMTL
jgi:hypothetical protein